MPYVIRRLSKQSLALTIVGAALSLVMAFSSAQAQAACQSTKASPVFSKFGDANNYSLLPGANFEAAISGWSTNGASVVAGNESYFVGSATDTKSLRVTPPGEVVTPSFCVGVEHPHFRFFAKAVSGKTGQLNVKLRWTNDAGVLTDSSVITLNPEDFGTWKATADVALATRLALQSSTQTRDVQIVFDVTGSDAVWQLDDVYIDPYRR